MNHKKETRRRSALSRRLADVLKYKQMADTKVPQTLYGTVCKDQGVWDAAIARKLKIAETDVAILKEVL